MRMTAVFAVTALFAAGAVAGQQNILLETPDTRLAEPFSLLRGARELRDGRLIVTDWIEERIAVVDLARGTVEDRGRVGAGPGEFRLPTSLLPFRGDSTLLVDLGNARLTVLDSDGRPGRSFQPAAHAARQPGAADASGHIYFTIPAWLVDQPLPNDSVELAVYDPDTHATRVIARVHGSRRPSSNVALTPRVPYVVFAAQDTWTVSAAGRIAIVRDQGYRVQWIDGGQTVTGPANAVTTSPVTEADRSDFVRRFLQASPVSGRGEDGGLGRNPAETMSRENVERMVRGSEFAEHLPAFQAGDVRADGAGRLWVGTWARTGQPRRYDVFDAGGRRRGTVQLRANRQLLTVGRAHVYVVHTDDDGLQTIERYPIPPRLVRQVDAPGTGERERETGAEPGIGDGE